MNVLVVWLLTSPILHGTVLHGTGFTDDLTSLRPRGNGGMAVAGGLCCLLVIGAIVGIVLLVRRRRAE